MPLRIVTFAYQNHKGEQEVRYVIPTELEFIVKPGFAYQPGWFLSGMDMKRDGARRSFFLPNIILPTTLHNLTLALEITNAQTPKNLTPEEQRQAFERKQD